jgi:hypothetical protein
MSKILQRRTADGRVRRLLQPAPTDGVILRRRTADGRIRRILRSAASSEVAVSTVAPAAFESLARQVGDDAVPLEGLALEGRSIAVLVEWLEQGNKVVADQSLPIEWSGLPAPMRVSLERLLASPGKRRLLGTLGRLRLLKRP